MHVIHTWIFILTSAFMFSTRLSAQESSPAPDSLQQASTVQVINTDNLTTLSDFDSIWEITKLAGGLRWPIILVLVVGLASILYKYSELIFDSRRAKPIHQFNFRSAPLAKMEQVVNVHPNNLIHQLYANMLNIYRSTGSAEDSHYEIANFVQLQQDKFSTFQNKLTFLSDTAGALGLLGTVWGMFVTFFRGNLDNQIILHGMGIALVTTLMGLVVSIILNFFSTQVQGFFRKKVDTILKKGEELRLRLLMLQQENRYNGSNNLPRQIDDDDIPTHLSKVTDAVEKSESQFEDEDFAPSKSVHFDLISISGDEQSAHVNSRLKKPFAVKVLDESGNGAYNQVVMFYVESGNGTFKNGNKVEETYTDNSGIAQTILILGNVVGDHVVKARLTNNSKYVTFSAQGVPATPSELKYISGNLQNLPAGQEIKEPFVVQLLDCYNNPIPDHPVTFKIKLGKGYFPGKKSAHVTQTDKNGYAKSYYILNSSAGFNSIIAQAQGLRRPKIEFEVLGQ